MADAFPDAKAGWVEEQVGNLWTVEMSETFSAQSCWIAERSEFDLESFARVQLSRGNFSKDVFDSSRRRLTIEKTEKTGVLAYRTFRIHFSYDDIACKVKLLRVTSGYTPEELKNGTEDKYGDKQLHREYNSFKF